MGFLGVSTIKCCALGITIMAVVTCLSAGPLSTSLVLGYYYYRMFHEARDYSDPLPYLRVDPSDPGVSAYDNCETKEYGFSTHWTLMLGINLACYAYLTVCTGLMLLGVVFPPVTIVGFGGHGVGCCV